MAQENIDFGAFPNDPDADAIRTAFQKVQNNFTELYSTTVSTGVVSVQPGTGITLNQPQGNVVITANLHSITVQTGANLRVGVGTPTGCTATITSGSTPFSIDLANSITVGNVTAVNITGRLTANSNAQPNITSVGNLTNLNVVGNINSNNVTANNFVGGNFTGNFAAPGSNTEIIYNKEGILGASPNVTWDDTVFKIVGDIEANNLLAETVIANLLTGNITTNSQPNITTVGKLLNLEVIGDIDSGNAYLGNVAVANYFIGNGALLNSISGSNTANWANDLAGGTAGAMVYQKAVDETEFLPAGFVGQALVSDGTAGPKWVNGTISGVPLGSNLNTLELGDWLKTNPPGTTMYDGSLAIRVDIDGDVNPTPNTVVVRDNNGNVQASWFIGQFGGTLSAAGPSSLSIPGGNPGDVLTTDGKGGLSWQKSGTGGVKAGGSLNQVQFNDGGDLAGEANLWWERDVDTLHASFFEGNGNALSHIWGPNVVDWVPRAVLAKNLVGGTGGVIPFQEQPNVTGFTDVGALNDALLSTGTGKPKWVPATISGIYLNNTLAKHTVGKFLSGPDYTGNSAVTWTVDATHEAVAEKIVARDQFGSFKANGIAANTLELAGTVQSTSIGDGTLIVKGGVGIAKDIFGGGNVTAKEFYGNFNGNFVGSLSVPAPEETVLFMAAGNVVTFNTDFKYDVDQSSLIAPVFRGNGSGLSNIPAANLIGEAPNANYAKTAGTALKVENANIANALAGGSGGEIVYQISKNVTGFAKGASGDVLVSGGSGAPTWTKGTISGVKLGENLETLSFGTGLLPTGATTYNGNKAVSLAIDVDQAATPSKIVQRTSTGSINADGDSQMGNSVTAKYFNGDLKGSIIGGFKPTSGQGTNDGIVWPTDPGGGSGDIAKIQYYSYSGDDCVLELSIENDNKDYINLKSKAGVGINKTGGVTSGKILDVAGNIYGSGDFEVSGAIKGATLEGDGSKVTNVKAASADSVKGSGVIGEVATANYATYTGGATSAFNLSGGDVGQVPYQSAKNTTKFLAAGTADQIISTTGTDLKWISGTISGAKLGTNLKKLTAGTGLAGGGYDGSGDITFTVDSTPAATPNKIVSRDAAGSFSANVVTATEFVGNIKGNLKGGTKNSIVYQTDVDKTGFFAIGTTGQMLTVADVSGQATLKWDIPKISGTPLGANLPYLKTGYGLAGGVPGYNGTGEITFTVDATPLALANRVCNRDASGHLYMNTCFATGLHAGGATTKGTITGNWVLSAGSRMAATYSDLAEYYAGDEEIAPGTVVDFGGSKEVTISKQPMSTRVAGDVTTDPAYVMNANIDAEFPTPIALQGRVPCMVVGEIRKGDIMVSAGNGKAMACSQPALGSIIGKSLEDFSGVAGIIEIAVGRL